MNNYDNYDNYIVEVDNVSMNFRLPKEKIGSLKEYIVKYFNRSIQYNDFYALKNISFKIKRGDTVGILGANGSGKSTLLKCICGVYPPSEGHVTVRGSIAPLIELGAGFDPELTARENIFLNGAVMGFDEKFIKEKYEEIVEFSELKQFMDVPIKNFSSGMFARLGFSAATIVQPDILIVDEILGVGDVAFQKKCHERMERMRSNKTTMLFVSHSLAQVRELCTKAIWLRRGIKVMDGDSEKVCDAYEKWSAEHSVFE